MGAGISKLRSKGPRGRSKHPPPPPPPPNSPIERPGSWNLKNRPSPVSRLPNELLLEIAKYLDTARDLYALRRVNKRLALLLDHLLSDILLLAYQKSATRHLLFPVTTGYHESIVVHLTRLGVDLNSVDCNCDATGECKCMPALHHAVTHSNETMVRSLLRHGAQVNVRYNRSGDNAVHMAVGVTHQNSDYLHMPRTADLAILRMLLADGVLQTMNDPASVNNVGLSWLNLAARRCPHGNVKIVEPFLSPGVSVDLADHERSLTPLHVAVWNNGVGLAAALLAMGADHRTFDSCGKSPFATACCRPNCALIDLLLRHDATLIDEVLTERGETADLCLQRKVEHMMATEDPESDYYQVGLPKLLKMLEKLRKLAKARRNSSTPDSLLQIYYNCL